MTFSLALRRCRDACCLASGRRLAVGNDAEGIAELAARLAPGSRMVMEASGGYERLLAEDGVEAAVVNALRVRQFARASGLLAKTDRLDAAVIARYGGFAQPAPTLVRAGAREALAETMARRRRLPAGRPSRATSTAARSPAWRAAPRSPRIARRGRRVIQGGRMEVRGALFMAVLALSRRQSRFARALVAKGKPKKLALVAIAKHQTPGANRRSRPPRDSTHNGC